MQEEIELRDIFTILFKRRLLIVALTLGAILLTGIISYFFLKPVYESEARVMVFPKVSDSTYSQIAVSSVVSEDVIRRLDLAVTPNQLREQLSVNSVDNTGILSFKVQDQDPQMAIDIANMQATVFQQQVGNVVTVESVQIVDPAIAPAERVSSNPLLNIAIAGVLALMIGVFLAFLLEYLDTSLSSPEEAEQQLDLPVMGVIPEIKSN